MLTILLLFRRLDGRCADVVGVFFGWLAFELDDKRKGDGQTEISVRASLLCAFSHFRQQQAQTLEQWRFNTLENPSLDVSLVSTGRMLQVNYLLLVSMIENHFIRERTPLSLLLLDGFRSTAV